jgi:hypothetical protein
VAKVERKNSEARSFELISLSRKANPRQGVWLSSHRLDRRRLAPLIIMMVEKSEYGGIDSGVLSRWLRTCFEDHLVRQVRDPSF